MTKVYCHDCQKLIFRNVDRAIQFGYSSMQKCFCDKCFQSLKAPNKNSQNLNNLQLKIEILQKELKESQRRIERFAKNGHIMKIFITNNLGSQMRSFTSFVDNIIDKEDCLENFVSIATNRIGIQLQKYCTILIERQTKFLTDILRTQQKNNQDLKLAIQEYSHQLTTSIKNLSIKSNFSDDLIDQDFEMDQNIAVQHQSKNKYFSAREVQGIDKIMQAKIDSLEDRQKQLQQLIITGKQISERYGAKYKIQQSIKEDQQEHEVDTNKSNKAISGTKEGNIFDPLMLGYDSYYGLYSEDDSVDFTTLKQQSKQGIQNTCAIELCELYW